MRPRTLAVAAVLLLRHGTALGQSVTLIDTAVLASPRLRESSGVVASARAGLYWTHNDSGDEPILYAVDSAGRDVGRVRVRGAGAQDWESIDAGPCVVAPGRCLYVGDIGDNRHQRSHVTIFRIVEPRPPSDAADTLRSVDVLDSLVLVYPEGPRDAESVIVTPDGYLLLVTKPRQGEPLAYWASLDTTGRLTPVHSSSLPIAVSIPRGRLVTGGAMAPDGRWVVLRTYVSLHFFVRDGTTSLRAGSPPEGIPIPYVEPQGEGIAFDGPDRLILTSEMGSRGQPLLVRLRVVLPPAP